MSVLWIVLPLAVAMAVAGVVAFVWAVRSGQFDDLETPGARALFDAELTAHRPGPGPDGSRAGQKKAGSAR